MDTSKQYIKMCDCSEIQEHSLHDGGGHFYAWKSPHFKKQVHVDSYPGGKGTSVWLPRQDQIQEMLIKEKFGDFDANWDICVEIPMQFVAKNPALELSSMEQIWLSCYMLSIHQKVWSSNEEKWVKK